MYKQSRQHKKKKIRHSSHGTNPGRKEVVIRDTKSDETTDSRAVNRMWPDRIFSSIAAAVGPTQYNPVKDFFRDASYSVPALVLGNMSKTNTQFDSSFHEQKRKRFYTLGDICAAIPGAGPSYPRCFWSCTALDACDQA